MHPAPRAVKRRALGTVSFPESYRCGVLIGRGPCCAETEKSSLANASLSEFRHHDCGAGDLAVSDLLVVTILKIIGK